MSYVATDPGRQMSVFYPRPYGAPFRALRRPHIGMGQSTQQIENIAFTGAATTVSILASLHAVIAGVAFAGPVGAAIAGLLAVGSVVASMFKGCGQTCVIAAQDANKFETPLQQNLSAYLNSPVHYASLQQAALNNVDTLFTALRQACSDPSLGDPGQRCISERLDASACHWKASPGGWTQDASGKWNYSGYGAAGSGDACWNWVKGYRDPIASDPSVVPDPTPTDTATTIATDVSTGAQNLLAAVTGGGSGAPAAGIDWKLIALPALLAVGLYLMPESGESN
jgi:hypothetical protein